MQFNAYLVGPAGTTSGNTGDGFDYDPYAGAFGGAANCSGAPFPQQDTHIVRIDLGEAAIAPDGVLVVDTCGTFNASALWAGDGCPNDVSTFNCLEYSNTDPTGSWCGNSTLGGEAVVFLPVTSRYMYVMVADAAGDGAPLNYVLNYVVSYSATPSPSGTSSNSPSASSTPSASLSHGAALSTSVTGSLSAASTRSTTPSAAASATSPSTMSSAPSVSVTPTQTPSVSLAPYCGASLLTFSAVVNGSSGAVTVDTEADPWVYSEAQLGGLACADGSLVPQGGLAVRGGRICMHGYYDNCRLVMQHSAPPRSCIPTLTLPPELLQFHIIR